MTWSPTRSEDLVVAAAQPRPDPVRRARRRRDGTFTGLRVRLVGDGGAYPGIGAFLPAGTKRMSNGTYRFPAIQFDVAVAVTNTTPMGAYRGAGRPEATALLERLVDHAAHELDIDPIELRKRNLLADDVFPFTTLTGVTYDSGRYATPLDAAAEAIGYDELRAEQAARRERGDRLAARHRRRRLRRDHRRRRRQGVRRRRGPRRRLGDRARRHVLPRPGPPDGVRHDRQRPDRHPGRPHPPRRRRHRPRAHAAAAPAARARCSSAARPCTRRPSCSSRRPSGSPPTCSRPTSPTSSSTPTPARSASPACRPARSAGPSSPGGPPRRRARSSATATASSALLAAGADFDQGDATFPFGAHIAVVEVDLDTGRSRVVRHVAVDDCGTVLNPLLVEGQQHGGIASGIGQALYEEVRYDADGNPLTANLADYGIPTAAELPSFEAHSTETPTPLNPLGAKGIGEAATIGSTPAVQNAVIDAVAHLGVRHLDMPCTSERVWRADPRRRGRHAARPVARAAGDLRHPPRRRRRRRGGPRAPPRASDPTFLTRLRRRSSRTKSTDESGAGRRRALVLAGPPRSRP